MRASNMQATLSGLQFVSVHVNISLILKKHENRFAIGLLCFSSSLRVLYIFFHVFDGCISAFKIEILSRRFFSFHLAIIL